MFIAKTHHKRSLRKDLKGVARGEVEGKHRFSVRSGAQQFDSSPNHRRPDNYDGLVAEMIS